MDLSVKMFVETVKITDAMSTRVSVRQAARVAGMETNAMKRGVLRVVHLRPVTDMYVQIVQMLGTVDRTVIHVLVIRTVETAA